MMFRRRKPRLPVRRQVRPLSDELGVRIVRQIGEYHALYLTCDEFDTFCAHVDHDAHIECCDGTSIRIADATVHLLPDTFSEVSLKVWY